MTKLSELISTLQYCLESYGDIGVTLAIEGVANDAPKGTQYMVTGKEEIIYSNFAKNDDGEEEISLQNFPY